MVDTSAITLTQFPAIAAARDRLVQLQGDLEACEGRINDLLTHLANLKPESLKEKALALIEGRLGPKADVSPLRKELEEQSERRRILTEAIALQRQRILDLEVKYSKEICERITPAYVSLVADIAATIAHLGSLLDQERQFREALHAEGVQWSSWLRPMPFPRVGGLADPSDRFSPAVTYLCEIARYYPTALPEGIVLPEARPAGLSLDLPPAPKPQPQRQKRKVDETEWTTDA